MSESTDTSSRSPNRWENGILQSEVRDMLLGYLLKLWPIVLVLLGDAVLERVIGLRLDEQVAQGLEDGADAGRGLPRLGLEDAEANVAEGVVCDVGVVDAGDELDDRRLEGVVGGEEELQAEAAGVVGRGLGRGKDDVPGVDGGFGGEADGKALGDVGGDFLILLGDVLDWCLGLRRWVDVPWQCAW